MLHENYLQKHCERSAIILGTPRLKLAPGALMKESLYEMSWQEFVATVALHNLFAPTTAVFVSTRKGWDVSREGWWLSFTLNCFTTAGGYSLPDGKCQFTTQSYDAPIYSAKLKSQGLKPIFH